VVWILPSNRTGASGNAGNLVCGPKDSCAKSYCGSTSLGCVVKVEDSLISLRPDDRDGGLFSESPGASRMTRFEIGFNCSNSTSCCDVALSEELVVGLEPSGAVLLRLIRGSVRPISTSRGGDTLDEILSLGQLLTDRQFDEPLLGPGFSFNEGEVVGWAA
jgi:hypothetical protein